MAYQTATATDVDNLLDKARLFLIAQGWAVNFWGARTTGSGQVLSVNKAGVHFTLYTDTSTTADQQSPRPYLVLRYHQGYAAQANPLTAQAGASPDVICNRMTGPMQAYHFFAGEGASGPYFHLVAETDPGTFKHAGLGVMDKLGAVNTGQYVHAAAWGYATHAVASATSSYHTLPWDDQGNMAFSSATPGTYFQADFAGVSPRHIRMDNQQNASGSFRGRGGFRTFAPAVGQGSIGLPVVAAASAQTGRSPLLPLLAMVDRGSDLFSVVGSAPDMRFVRMDYLEPGQDYPLGTDTWLVFPAIRKNGVAGLPNSSYYGYAYRRQD